MRRYVPRVSFFLRTLDLEGPRGREAGNLLALALGRLAVDPVELVLALRVAVEVDRAAALEVLQLPGRGRAVQEVRGAPLLAAVGYVLWLGAARALVGVRREVHVEFVVVGGDRGRQRGE